MQRLHVQSSVLKATDLFSPHSTRKCRAVRVRGLFSHRAIRHSSILDHNV